MYIHALESSSQDPVLIPIEKLISGTRYMNCIICIKKPGLKHQLWVLIKTVHQSFTFLFYFVKPFSKYRIIFFWTCFCWSMTENTIKIH